MLPGGFEQATITCIKENRVYIKSRKGFIKYALQHGYFVYPTYSFNENKLYWTLDKFLNFRLFLNKIKMVAVIFFS